MNLNKQDTQRIRRKFSNPIIFFDLETTGINPASDKIVQICIIKLFPDGSTEQKTRLINPGVPIPFEATEIHGITDDNVKDSPSFKQVSSGFYDFINGCDLAGYNSNHFDIPLLLNEFERAGIEFNIDLEKNNIIDVFKIYKHFNKRDLASCFLDYCDEQFLGGHDAGNDAIATIKIFNSMLQKHENDLNDSFFKIETMDLSGHLIKKEDGNVYFNFGKHKGRKVIDEISYSEWILSSNFPESTKKIIRSIISPNLLKI